MERREFLKLFGLGAAIVGVAAATMSPTQAATLLVNPPADTPSTDDLVKDVAEKTADQGEFAQYYYYRRRRWRRPYYRRRWRRRYYRRRYYW